MNNPQTVTEKVHHPFSPSTLQNREACPCYGNRSESNAAAIAGTLQHSVTETGEDDHRLSDDEALAAAECLDFYERQKTLMLEARTRAFNDHARKLVAGVTDMIFPDIIELVEAYLPIDDCTFEDGAIATTAGYVDRALVSWDRKSGVLLDWKFGAWAVEKADNNLQGIAYALGLFKKFPTLETVKFFFKQPHLDLLTEATFTRAQVPELYLRVQTVVARARAAMKEAGNDNWSAANPMVPVCNFCANIGKCAKVAEFACKVGSKFYPLEIPSDITPTGLKDAKDTALGLRLSQVMAVWAKSFRAQVTERTIRGAAPVPDGFKIETRADREIVEPAKFRDVTLGYLTEGELSPLASYTFGSVEDAIKDKAPRGSKKSTLEEYQQKLMASGAVKLGDSYTFLKAVSKKSNE